LGSTETGLVLVAGSCEHDNESSVSMGCGGKFWAAKRLSASPGWLCSLEWNCCIYTDF